MSWSRLFARRMLRAELPVPSHVPSKTKEKCQKCQRQGCGNLIQLTQLTWG